jgi:hypothetical protein
VLENRKLYADRESITSTFFFYHFLNKKKAVRYIIYIINYIYIIYIYIYYIYLTVGKKTFFGLKINFYLCRGLLFLPKCCFFCRSDEKKTRRAEKNVFFVCCFASHYVTLHYITFYAFLLCYFVEEDFFNIYVVCELCNVM